MSQVVAAGRRRRAAALALSACLAAALVAPESVAADPLIERTELRRAPLEGTPGTVVVMTRLEATPGARLPRHTHPGDEMLYVLQGGRIQPLGRPEQAVEAGSTMRFPRGEAHGGFTVVGERTIRVLTVHVVDADKPLMQVME